MNVLEENDKLESLHYTDEEIAKKESGEMEDTAPFDITVTFKDVDTGEDRYIQSFKMLNNELNGICRKNGVMFIGASSGSGKSTVTLQMVLGLVESGEKVLFISNEQVSKYFKDLLMAFVCINKFDTMINGKRVGSTI
jgi:predicted ATP-dependent serine protease